MRGIWLISCLVALGACDNAVVLEVYPAPGVQTDEVQLFIGLGSCGACPGIQPPGSVAILPGEVLYRDDSYRTSRPRTAKVEGGVARFRIEASEVADAFTLAVVVDSNQRSAALIRSLPLDDAGTYRVDLRAANTSGARLGPKPAMASGDFIDIWPQPNGTFSCMGFERWSDGRLDGRLFIVPGDDLDCDSQPPMECAPYGYESTGVPTFENTSCTRKEAATAGSICWLGGPACDEKTGVEHTCVASDYCVPSSYCDPATNAACGEVSGAIDVDACLFGGDAVARLKCTIAFEPADNMRANLCDTSFAFDLMPPQTSPVACVPPDRDHELLYERPLPGAMRAFTDKVTFTTKDASGKVFPLDFKLHYIHKGCTFKAEVYGDKAVNVLAPDDKLVFAQFWTSKNGGRARKLLVPVEMSFANDCGQPSQCTLVLDESTNNCLR